MKLTRACNYGLCALAFIAEQDRAGGSVLAREVAAAEALPPDYLFKVLKQLVRAGLLRSARGPRDGFALCRGPEHISLLEIVEAIEGPFLVQSILQGDAPPSRRTHISAALGRVGIAARAQLKQVTLNQLIG